MLQVAVIIIVIQVPFFTKLPQTIQIFPVGHAASYQLICKRVCRLFLVNLPMFPRLQLISCSLTALSLSLLILAL